MRLAKYSRVPVINALSDLEHPTQIVSDLLTIQEVKGKLKGLKLAYVGDGNNVCNSLLLGGALEGMNISVACPAGYEPNETVLSEADKTSPTAGGRVYVELKPQQDANA